MTRSRLPNRRPSLVQELTYRGQPISGEKHKMNKTIAEEMDGMTILSIAAGTSDAPKSGAKADHGKPPYHLLAPEMLDGTARVLAFGAEKYAPRNWELGMSWSRPFSALMRHMWAWWRGEKADSETGMSHLWHASCCIMFLLAYEERRIGEDDRPK